MTTEEREAITTVLQTYIKAPHNFYISPCQLANEAIYGALKMLLGDNVLTLQEISNEIKAFTSLYIRPKRLERYAQNIFNEIEHKKCS